MNNEQYNICLQLAAAVQAVTQPQVNRDHNTSHSNIVHINTFAKLALKALEKQNES